MSDSERSRPSWRWMVLLSKAFISFFGLGLFKAMGVFIPCFVQELDTTVSAVGTVASVYGGLCSVLAPFASAMTFLGPRQLVVVGGAVMGLATIAAATSPSIGWLAVWLSLASMGETFVMVSSLKPLMDYFPESFATCIGLCFALGTVGMMTLPPLSEWLLELFGWRAALCLLGALTLNVMACGALLRPASAGPRYRALPQKQGRRSSGEPPGETAGEDRGRCSARLASLMRDRLDASLLADEPAFLLHLAASFLVGAVYDGWQLFLVPRAQWLGYGSQEASFLSTFGGLGSLAGRVANGLLADAGLVSPTTQMALASCLVAVSSLLDPVASGSFASLAALAVLTGLGIGFTYPLTIVLVREIVPEEDRQMAAFGWLYLFLGCGQIFGGYLSGWLYDASRDYELVFVVYGGLSIAVVPFVLSTRLAKLCGSQTQT